MYTFSSSYQVDAIYIDFSKAFGKLNHTILANKLNVIEIRDPLIHGSFHKKLTESKLSFKILLILH